jgi:hypothetical protein
MKSKISILVLLCLAVLASGMAAAQGDLLGSVPAAVQGAYATSGQATGQAAALAACPQYGQAAAEGTFGTKVVSGDSDVGLPLSLFTPPVGAPGANQGFVWISYWDMNANSIYDDQDIPYLQFGSINTAGGRFVRANNIRLTGWGNYPAGSYVKPSDSDMGQPLGVPPLAVPPPATMPALPSSAPPFQVNFYYLNVVGSQGYDLGDPVYLKVLSPVAPIAMVGTNDIRITPNAGFPAGSKVSLNDPDAGKFLTLFEAIPIASQPTGGPTLAWVQGPIARFAFYNANGNVNPLGLPIYDDGDVVYFDVSPIPGPTPPISSSVVSPNDIRLF